MRVFIRVFLKILVKLLYINLFGVKSLKWYFYFKMLIF